VSPQQKIKKLNTHKKIKLCNNAIKGKETHGRKVKKVLFPLGECKRGKHLLIVQQAPIYLKTVKRQNCVKQHRISKILYI
jgi:hypothetical protein